MKKIALSLVGLLVASLTLAQQSVLRGSIIDKNTAEPLIGATVVVEGTTNGTISDFDGNYSLPLEAGTYNIRCSFISYEAQVIEGVEVKADDVTILDFQLGGATEDIEEVVVQAKAITRTEAAIVTLQRKSANVLDGISAQQISRLGDSDAAGALKRVTGVSVEGGKYVYVRGLSDRYSKTTLNNAEIPGLDPDRNTVQMDLFPSNIIENMVVHKTFSPDLPGSFTGGHVNIMTKDFPERFTFLFSSSMGYNPKANLNDDFLSYEGGNTDWLGFDDGTREIPAEAEGEIPGRFQDDERLTNITQSFSDNMAPIKEQSFLNHSHSISLGNQTQLFGKIVGFNAGFSYSRNFKYYDDGSVGRYKLISPDNTTLDGQLVVNDEVGSEEIIWSSLVNGNIKLNNNHMIGLMVVRNQSGDISTRRQEGSKSSDEAGMDYYTTTLQFLERSFTSAQLKGEHFFKNISELKVEWLSSYTVSKQDEPDLRFFTYHYTESSGFEISPSLYPVPTRYFRNMEESNFDNKIDFTLPFSLGGYASKLKFGGALVIKDRQFASKIFMFPENTNSFNGSINDYYNHNNMHSPYGIYVEASELTNKKNSYDGYQSVGAGYAMVDMPLGKLRIIAGARIEQTYMTVESRKTDEEDGELDNLDVLPALNMTYSITDMMNLRMGYSRTLARPSFREMAPFASLEFVGDFVKVGNPTLERTQIDNVDLRWEYFMQAGELISVSGFYKVFHNPIEAAFNTEAANPELTWRNVDEATVYGVEFEVRKKLNFIDFLKDFQIGGNYTWVQSEVSIDAKELERKRYFDPDFPDTRVMFGQAPYIINAFINYTNDNIGFSANAGYNISGERLYLVNAYGIPDVYEQPRANLDVTLGQQIGEHISLKFSAKNLLDSEYRQTYEYEGNEYVYGSYTLARAFSLGFTYLID